MLYGAPCEGSARDGDLGAAQDGADDGEDRDVGALGHVL